MSHQLRRGAGEDEVARVQGIDVASSVAVLMLGGSSGNLGALSYAFMYYCNWLCHSEIQVDAFSLTQMLVISLLYAVFPLVQTGVGPSKHYYAAKVVESWKLQVLTGTEADWAIWIADVEAQSAAENRILLCYGLSLQPWRESRYASKCILVGN